MNLHESVNEYIRTWETLGSFVGYFRNGNDGDLKSIIDFSKLVDKLDYLFGEIMAQSKKEDVIVATYEMKRVTHPELNEDNILELIFKELNDE